MTASALSAPVTRRTSRFAESSIGSVIVTRSTNGSRPAGPLVDAPLALGELRRAGEERGHVRVRAEAEQLQVELDALERLVVLERRGSGSSSPRIRCTSGGRSRLSSSVRWASRKFERSSSGGTQRSSPHQTAARLQSGSSAAALLVGLADASGRR